MDRSAKALESFCEDDETWVDSWTVSAVGRGWSAAMPGLAATETVGLTDERLLWFDDDLEAVDRADIEAVSTAVVDHQDATPLVRGGAAALVLGALGSIALLFVLSVPLTTGLVPLAAGLLAFVGSVGFARARKRAGEQLMQHRLRIEAGDSAVTVWGDDEVVESLAAALDRSTDS